MPILISILFLWNFSAFANETLTHAHHSGEETCSSKHVSTKEALDLAETMKTVTGKMNVLLRPEFCRALESCEGIGTVTGSCADMMTNYKSISKWLVAQKSGTCGMTPEEVLAVRSYTGGSFVCINTYLWNPSKKLSERQILVDVLNSGLKKLPVYKGLVRRGVEFPSNVKVQHQKGAIVTYESFTSASTAGAYVERRDQVLMFSSTGRPVMGFSSFKESEVIFPSNTKFRVLDVIEKSGKSYYILKEVTMGTKEEQAAEDKKVLEMVAKVEDAVDSPDRFVCPLTGEASSEFIQIKRPLNIKDFQIQ